MKYNFKYLPTPWNADCNHLSGFGKFAKKIFFNDFILYSTSISVPSPTFQISSAAAKNFRRALKESPARRTVENTRTCFVSHERLHVFRRVLFK